MKLDNPTVADLIEALQQFPKDVEVMITDREYGPVGFLNIEFFQHTMESGEKIQSIWIGTPF